MISIKTEAMPGCSVGEAAIEMLRLAKTLNVIVDMNFNDVYFFASPHDPTALDVEIRFDQMLETQERIRGRDERKKEKD